MKETKQVLYTSDDAAKFVTNISGWIDCRSRFWGNDEHMARWSGCTHVVCPNCGKPTQKTYTICSDCREKRAIERYKAKERKEWDGNTPLYSETADEYFFDQDDLNDYLDTRDCTAQSLQLVICEPEYFREIESDYFYDDLPEDNDIPSEIADALEDLNRVIREQGPSLWHPGKYAAKIE